MPTPTFLSNDRQHLIDQKLEEDVSNADLCNKLFIRLVAKEVKFTNVDFKYTIFDACYLRQCVFDSCDFTGCRFIGVNLSRASFIDCKFEYATFDKTIVDRAILDTCFHGKDNLRLIFARTLRMNYQQLGDIASVNKAIRVELIASEAFLLKAWISDDPYCRKKYSNLKRIYMFVKWSKFKILDIIWGNGENIHKLLRSAVILLVIMSIIDVFISRDITKVTSYWNSLTKMPGIFLGVTRPSNYNVLYLASINFLRLVTIGFFMSIIIKRLNRR